MYRNLKRQSKRFRKKTAKKQRRMANAFSHVMHLKVTENIIFSDEALELLLKKFGKQKIIFRKTKAF